MNIREQLFALQDSKYQQFSSALIPNIDAKTIIGVRVPLLRQIAKEIAKTEPLTYLQTAQGTYFEELLLQGMVIGYMKVSPQEKLPLIAQFIPKIDNWSVCDSFCSGLKFTKSNQALVWDFLQPYFKSKEAYDIRFAVVMLLNYYVDERYIQETLRLLDGVSHEDYYVKMAVAWAVSICYIKMPKETMPYLQNNNLDLFTYNKALQKITESLRIDADTKKMIRAMRRK
ncbi:DNA alkylation repair protein [Lysinibacillus contaminans]|uniref:DNA alkylation repair protein n=1 Tax=Lysinibacillus contaminans TaxID=1293441 RepID=A0ABR5K064_9BACI|nr:DNA alkylation repair protein [Lysinibacillus contaminans]KOS68293.1 DNA alkylation repair protein [Lysinibacillus contaminans]